MDSLVPDFSEALETTQIPPGVYKVRVDSWEAKESKTSGKPYLNWKLVIFGAEGDLHKQNNRPVFLITMLQGPGAGVLKDFLKATLGELPAFEQGWQNQCIGKELTVTLTKNIRPDGTEGMPNVRGIKPLEH